MDETEPGEWHSADGISLYNYGGKLVANINGDVEAKAANGNAIGIKTDHSSGETGSQFGDGSSEILVHGNVISDDIGVALDTFGENTDVNVLVEDEIQAKKVGVSIGRTWFAEDESETEPKLTVWKINLNDRGNAVEWGDFGFDYIGDDEAGKQYKAKTIANFEKHIMYIIRVEQPGEGGTIKAVDKDGNVLAKSYDFDVAHEGDKVILKANLAEGYKLIAAYNGQGEKVPLLKDESGNYYIVVPKGGGVYLSVELESVTEHSYSDAEDNTDLLVGDSESDAETPKQAENLSSPAGESKKAISKEMVYSEPVKTGDSAQVAPWLLLSVISAGGVIGLEALNKKNSLKKVNEE